MNESRLEFVENTIRAVGTDLLAFVTGKIEHQGKIPLRLKLDMNRVANQTVINRFHKVFPGENIQIVGSGFRVDRLAQSVVVSPVEWGLHSPPIGSYFAIGLTFFSRHEPVVSTIYFPESAEIVLTEKGSGAFKNGVRLRVSDEVIPSSGYYVQGEKAPYLVQAEIMRVLFPDVTDLWHSRSPLIDLCRLADGSADFEVAYDVETERAMPGKLILEEAGGRMTAWDSGALNLKAVFPKRITYLASNGAVHDKLSAILEKASLAGCLQGYISTYELESLASTALQLNEKIESLRDDVPSRICNELDIPITTWKRNSDLAYLVGQAERLIENPLDFLRDIFLRIAPRLMFEEEREALLYSLNEASHAWQPGKQAIEIFVQAIEVLASENSLYEQMLSANYQQEVLQHLKITQVDDAFSIGVRLKRNAFRQIQALQGWKDNAAVEPVQELSNLTSFYTDKRCRRSIGENVVAGLVITGGRGTRLRTSIPKGIVPLHKRPFLNYTLDALRGAGVNDMAVVIGYKADLHRHLFGNSELVFIEQASQQGTAHAVWVSRGYYEDFSGTLLISYSDTPLIQPEDIRALINHHHAYNAVMTILTTSRQQHPEFGRIFRKDSEICAVGQVRFSDTESDEVDGGFYCVKCPEFWRFLGEVKNDNNRREFILTEIAACLYRAGQKIETYYLDNPIRLLSANRPSDLVQLDRVAYLYDKCQLSLPGDWQEIYWKLRFYEGYGGIPARFVIRDPKSAQQVEDGLKITKYYDDALEREIGPIFRCPPVSVVPFPEKKWD